MIRLTMEFAVELPYNSAADAKAFLAQYSHSAFLITDGCNSLPEAIPMEPVEGDWNEVE